LDQNLKSLVDKAAVHSVTKNVVYSSLEIRVPLRGDFAALKMRLHAETPVNNAVLTGAVVLKLEQISLGFCHQLQYILSDATEVQDPIWARDDDSGELSLVDYQLAELDRARLVPPKLIYTEKEGNFLDLTGELF